MTIYADNSYSIGNTPLVRLKHFGQNGNVVVKLKAVIKLQREMPYWCQYDLASRKDGILTAGKEIVDATSGNYRYCFSLCSCCARL